MPNSDAVGKANFSFVAKYQHGASVPTGNTQFTFQVAGLKFNGTADDWLVITGNRAQFKGTGTINDFIPCIGERGTVYGFTFIALDGDLDKSGPDRLRIRIWDQASGVTVYDNEPGISDSIGPYAPIGGGSIAIRKN